MYGVYDGGDGKKYDGGDGKVKWGIVHVKSFLSRVDIVYLNENVRYIAKFEIY